MALYRIGGVGRNSIGGDTLMNKVHFIGIGGTGISAIARLLLERGVQVSGTDLQGSPYFDSITNLGAITRLGHHPDLAIEAELVVRSSAVKEDDPEVQAALKAGIPVLKRAEFLPQLTAGYKTLAVAGSHGKTTTTAMLVHLLQSDGLDPSFILGAQIKGQDTNAHAGEDQLFVIEADEYDYMFLGLYPTLSVVTNIDYDHPDFFATPRDYTQAFVDFLENTQENSTILLCGDDPGIHHMLPASSYPGRQLLKYGFEPDNDIHISDYQVRQDKQEFCLRSPENEKAGPFTIHQPGKFNVLNAAAALAAAHLAGRELGNLTGALSTFEGTSRRFDLVCEYKNIKVFNDYGHHPTQILQTLEGARQSYPAYEIWAVWEPHTISRTRQLGHEFAQALDQADQAVILKLFGAREEDPSFSPAVIAAGCSRTHCLYLPDNSEAVGHIIRNLTGRDLIIVFSAGKGPEFSQELCSAINPEGTNE